MIFVSSSMVFESATRFPSREDELLSLPPPFTAYGFSKLIGEWYCRAFFDQYGLRYTICRPFNAIGPEEEAGEEVGDAHVIPDLVKKVLGGQHPLELLGDGTADALLHPRARHRARHRRWRWRARRRSTRTSTSAPPRRSPCSSWRAASTRLCAPERPFEVTYVPGFASDIRRRVPDGSKAKRLLGWEPTITIDEGLRECVAAARERR